MHKGGDIIPSALETVKPVWCGTVEEECLPVDGNGCAILDLKLATIEVPEAKYDGRPIIWVCMPLAHGVDVKLDRCPREFDTHACRCLPYKLVDDAVKIEADVVTIADDLLPIGFCGQPEHATATCDLSPPRSQ